jgi:hypothetical protein
LTPGPSFAHNLGYRCPNDQCEAIFYIYASRSFQWNQEHLNARCFGPCCRTLNIRESRRTPNPQLWKCRASPPHLAKVGLRHYLFTIRPFIKKCPINFSTFFLTHEGSCLYLVNHMRVWNFGFLVCNRPKVLYMNNKLLVLWPIISIIIPITRPK